ncbi:MAG TPA: PIN domain-containing protein [Solirubrobacteraceae bacterium]|nr:PIN domain-containing protein [Solirubrobacteraceae bacterium]
MRERTLWDGAGAVLVDTSAWIAAKRISAARELLTTAVERGDVAWCWPVRYELSLDARDARQLAAVDRTFEGLREIAVDRSVQRGVLSTMRELARDGSHGSHRFPLPDLTVAVAAQRAGLSVLHFDRHFERLRAVLGVDTRWIADPSLGS